MPSDVRKGPLFSRSRIWLQRAEIAFSLPFSAVSPILLSNLIADPWQTLI